MTRASTQRRASPPQWNRLLAALRQQELEEAESLCRAGVERDPKEALWHLGMSWVLMGRHDLQGAIKSVRRAARRDRTNAAIYRTMATLLLQKGDVELALEAAQIAMRIEPDATSKALVHRAQQLRRKQATRQWRKDAVPKVEATQTNIMYIGRREPTSLADRLSAPARGSLSLPGGGEVDADHSAAGDFAQSPTVIATTLTADGETLVIPISAERITDDGERRRRSTGAADLARHDELSGDLQRQLHAVYGASLFGDWDMTVRPTPVAGLLESPAKTWRRRVLIVVSLLLIGAAWVAANVITRTRAVEQRAANLARMSELIQNGSLDALAAELPALTGSAPEVGKDSSLVRARALAEALLYRYRDGGENRRRRALALIEGSSPDAPYTVLTRALLTPALHRGELLDALAGTAAKERHDPLPGLLLADSYEAAGSLTAARKTLTRALRLQPNNLLLLGRLALLEEARGNLFAGLDRATEMLDVRPDDPMTHFVESALRLREEPIAEGAVDQARARADALPPALGGALWLEIAATAPTPEEAQQAITGVKRRWKDSATLVTEGAQRLLLAGRLAIGNELERTSIAAAAVAAARTALHAGDRRHAAQWVRLARRDDPDNAEARALAARIAGGAKAGRKGKGRRPSGTRP